MKKTFLSILVITILNVSCTRTNEVPIGKFATGVFVINEGNFSESNGSISHFNTSNSKVSRDLFEEANNVSPGGIIQSVYFYDNVAFIIDQLGNTIEVVEAETFKSITTIDQGLSTPRYMTIANGKGYISNWGSFDANFNLTESYVAVVDLESYTVTATIDTDSGSEGFIASGGNVYVANSFSNTVQEIHTTDDAIVATITVANGPQEFIEDINGKVWLLSNSFLSGSTLSQLDLSLNQVIKSFAIGESAKSLNINGSGDQLYYLSAPFGADAEVRSVAVTATTDTNEALITQPNLYGLGVDPQSGIIYLGNHNGFQGNGTVLRYEQGSFIDNFAVGVAPNGFVFRP